MGAEQNGGGGEDDEQLQQPLQALRHEATGSDMVQGEARGGHGKQHVHNNVEMEKGTNHFANASIGTGQH